MRTILVGAISGWLFSCWVQVPAPLQSGLKTVVGWLSAKVADKLFQYETRMKAEAKKTASLAPDANSTPGAGG